MCKTRQNYATKLKFGTNIHTHMQFQKIYILVPRPLNFADISIFLAKNQHFFGRYSTFTQSNSIRAVLEIFQFCFQVLKDKKLLLVKIKFYRPCVQNPASARPANLPYIGKKTMTSQFTDLNSPSIFFHVDVFLLSSLVTGSSYISLSQLVLELWQFFFIKDWPEIRKSKMPQSEFCPISRGWNE